jgi:hypothetical protein
VGSRNAVRALAAALTIIALLVAGAAEAQSPDYNVPTPNLNPPPVVPTPYLNPPPVVRFVGTVRNKNTRVTRFRIKAPRGAKVRATCTGGKKRGCKTSSKTRTAGKSGLVRFKEMERTFHPKAVLDVYIRKGNTVGKHTRFKIRQNKLPSRKDDCLLPGVSKPRACPAP